ncbi:MAG: hypothetical protein K0U98_07340 [Deltaproteobacteria bacterium]|nr:hypothetical protein [Deltaproteobacteria bacterium]
MLTEKRPSTARWTPILSGLLILLFAAALAVPVAAQEALEAPYLLTLDPQGLVTEVFFDASSAQGDADDNLGSTVQGIFGGGGGGCTGYFCRSFAAGPIDNCTDCTVSCPGNDHPDSVSWWTSDQGWDPVINDYWVSGGTACHGGGIRTAAGLNQCTSDEAGVVCRDCANCIADSDYCP